MWSLPFRPECLAPGRSLGRDEEAGVNFQISPGDALRLAQAAGRAAEAAQVIALFGEAEPDLAGECGVEVCALEARALLSGGAPDRLARAAAEAARTGRPATVSADDFSAVTRLEAVAALGRQRIDLKAAALDAEASQEGLARLGGILSLASSAYGILKTVL